MLFQFCFTIEVSMAILTFKILTMMGLDMIRHQVGVDGYKAEGTLGGNCGVIRARVFVGFMQPECLLSAGGEGTLCTTILC